MMAEEKYIYTYLPLSDPNMVAWADNKFLS